MYLKAFVVKKGKNPEKYEIAVKMSAFSVFPRHYEMHFQLFSTTYNLTKICRWDCDLANFLRQVVLLDVPSLPQMVQNANTYEWHLTS